VRVSAQARLRGLTPTQRAVGVASAVASAAGSLRLVYPSVLRTLSIATAVHERAFRRMYLPPPSAPLTLWGAWDMLGPRATHASVRHFRNTHSRAAFAGVMALVVASVVSGSVQPVVESTLARLQSSSSSSSPSAS
jgi:hypothetical protein